VLFLDAEDNFSKKINNYTQDISRVFNKLTYYNTYIKGHPRLGHSKLALNYNFKILDNSFPVEFIDLSNCKCIIGVNSIALANIANRNISTISLLKYLDYRDPKIRKETIDYLEMYCMSSIYYPESFEDFEALLKTLFSARVDVN
jgi:hypothetical protein